VSAQLRQIVGEVLTACEVLLERGEAATERVAAGVDDARVGQHQVNETQVQEVVWQLVDEEGAAALALDAGARQVVLTERAQLMRLQRCKRFRIAQPAGAAAGTEAVGDGRHVRQLHGAFDLRVAGKHLLDER